MNTFAPAAVDTYSCVYSRKDTSGHLSASPPPGPASTTMFEPLPEYSPISFAFAIAGDSLSHANLPGERSSTTMGNCAKIAPVCRPTASSAVTTSTGHDGRYLDMTLDAAPVPVTTTMSSASQSTAPPAADAAADSSVVNGRWV